MALEGWLNGCITFKIDGGWNPRRMDGWPVGRWMDGWIKINRLMKGGMNGRIDRWMGGKWTGGIAWMDE